MWQSEQVKESGNTRELHDDIKNLSTMIIYQEINRPPL